MLQQSLKLVQHELRQVWFAGRSEVSRGYSHIHAIANGLFESFQNLLSFEFNVSHTDAIDGAVLLISHQHAAVLCDRKTKEPRESPPLALAAQKGLDQFRLPFLKRMRPIS